MLEGETQSQLVRIDYPMVRVRKLDPHTQEPVKPEYAIDFRPGNFAWGPGRPRPRGRGRVVIPCGHPGPVRQPGRPGGRAGHHARRSVPARRQVVHARLDAGAGARRRPQGGADGQDPPPVQGTADAPGAGRPEREPELVRARSAVLSQSPRPKARRSSPSCTSTAPSWSRTSSTPQGRRQGRGGADPLRDQAGSDQRTYEWRLEGQAGKPRGASRQRPDDHLRGRRQLPARRHRPGRGPGRVLDPAGPVPGAPGRSEPRCSITAGARCRCSPT